MNLLRNPWNVVFLIGFLIYGGIRHVFMKRTKAIEKVVRRVDSLEMILLTIVFIGSILIPIIYLFTPLFAFADYPLPAVVHWCGSAVMLAALWLFWRSHMDLGLNFSMTLEIRTNHQIITRGAYRHIRHPMYAAIWLWGIAQAALLENVVAGFSALVTFAPLYFLRVPREEQMMFESFGREYSDYKEHTGRILPRFL